MCSRNRKASSMSSSSSSSSSSLSAPLLPVTDSDDGHRDDGKARTTFTYAAALFSVSAVAFLAGNLLNSGAGGNIIHSLFSSSVSDSAHLSSLNSAAAANTRTIIPSNLSPAEAKRLFDEANARLLAGPPPPPPPGGDNHEAEEGYELSDVVLSSALADEYYRTLHPALLGYSSSASGEAREACEEEEESGRGGKKQRSAWPCLEHNDRDDEQKVVRHMYGEHPLPKGQSRPSSHVVKALGDMVLSEPVGSVAEFGAGAGQLKAAVLNGMPSLAGDDLTEYLDHAKAAEARGLEEGKGVPEPLRYEAYDAAGNVASWTNDFVRHSDPSRTPLSRPKADWVVSLGNDFPVRRRFDAEGMMIRNLHHHNCRGILIDGGGTVPVILLRIFETLGYEYDDDMSAKFLVDETQEGEEGSGSVNIMVFRRPKPVC